MSQARYRQPGDREQQMIESVEVELLSANQADRARYRDLMSAHHYLKSDLLVGEQLRYVAMIDGQWVALLSWSAAARSLKERENWLGWSGEQKRRRLAFLANNARFLILPGVDCPNLATRLLALCSERLSQDWQQAYGHGILAVESFVDSQLFRGTCYKAQGWSLLGHTQGFGRKSQDYYVAHDRPKQLWVRALHPQARAILSAPCLPPELQAEENKVVPVTQAGVEDLRGLWALCRHAVPDWRKSKGRDYPLPCLLAIIVMAMLCGVVRGQRDLAAFASKLTQRQLRALRSYRRRDGKYEYPKETTFQRVLANIDADALEKVLQAWEDQMLEAAGGHDMLIALDGKAQRGSTPHVADEKKAQLVSAQSLPGGRVLGTVLVEEKSNEIPAARNLLEKLGNLDGKLVMLDALHTNQATLRQIHQDNGADYLLPVKDNHEGLATRAAQCLAPPQPVEPPTRRKTKSAPFNPPAVDLPPLNPAGRPVRYRRKRRTQQPLSA